MNKQLIPLVLGIVLIVAFLFAFSYYDSKQIADEIEEEQKTNWIETSFGICFLGKGSSFSQLKSLGMIE